MKHSEKIYNDTARETYTILNKLNVEWWPTEGTLLGLLRWGNNFGKDIIHN